MGLFDKKYCSICGQKIKMLQNTRLQDGNLCRECRGKLSPFYMVDFMAPTVGEVAGHLAYRERNRDELRNFHATECFGEDCRMFIDGVGRKFVLATEEELAAGSPDVFDISAVVRAEAAVSEQENEHRNSDSDSEEYYTYSYSVMLELELAHPTLQLVGYQVHPKAIYSGRGRIDMERMRQVYEGTAEINRSIFASIAGNTRKVQEEYLKYYSIAQDMVKVLERER